MDDPTNANISGEWEPATDFSADACESVINTSGSWLLSSTIPVVTCSGSSAPAFTAFGITDVSGPLEVGAAIAEGDYTFTWTTSNSGSVEAGSIAIADTTASTTLDSGLDNTGSDVISLDAVENDSPATQVWTISGTDTSSNTFTRTFSVAWEWKIYAGTSASETLDATGIKALTDYDSLQAGFAGTYSLSAGNYKYFCYPDDLGDVAVFRDTMTMFLISMATSADNAAYSNTANGWSYDLVSVTNAHSITTNYRVYRSQYTLGGALSMGVS